MAISSSSSSRLLSLVLLKAILIPSLLLLLISNSPLKCRAGNVLYSAGPMYPGQFLKYKDYKLALQQDCNMVLSDNNNGGNQVWATNTGSSACYLNLHGTGLAALYNNVGNKIWNTNKQNGNGNGNSVLVLRKDRNLAIYGPGRWSTNTQVGPTTPLDTDMRAENVLYTNDVFYPGYSLKNGRWELKLEPNCNLVLYEDGKKVIWNSNSAGPQAQGVCYMLLHGGKLTIYNRTMKPIWTTTNPSGAESVLVLQNNRNVVLYGNPIWTSGTKVSGVGLRLPSSNTFTTTS